MRFPHRESDSRGGLIAFRLDLNFQIENEIENKSGRILILKVTIQGSNLINTYNANTEQEQFTVLDQLDEFLDTIEINRNTQILLGVIQILDMTYYRMRTAETESKAYVNCSNAGSLTEVQSL